MRENVPGFFVVKEASISYNKNALEDPTAAGKEKGTAVPADQVKKKSKLHVAVVEGPALLETDGAIQYISDGVTLTGENGARTPDGGVSYIIFK